MVSKDAKEVIVFNDSKMFSPPATPVVGRSTAASVEATNFCPLSFYVRVCHLPPRRRKQRIKCWYISETMHM
jgi:hypothetical protein